jgi:type VI secretion system secreted protein VgrG
MGSSISQMYRLLRVATPLGPDRVVLRAFTGREAVSELFSFQLDLLSEDPAINFDDLVGQNVTFAVTLADGQSYRYFNGFISRFAQLPALGRLARYQAEVVPRLWFLTRTADCRIYQNQTVPDIIQDVLQRHNVRDVEVQLQGNYRKWEYCVQYRESAYNFIQRLMEQEGIFYFFKHEDGKHTLVLADSPSAHPPCPNQETARYEPSAGPGFAQPEDYVTSWRLQHELRPGRCTATDFNFETPTTSLMASLESKIRQGGNTSLEIYDFPGEYLRRDEGEREVRLRMEQEEAAHILIQGASYCRAFTPGYRFELQDHDRRDQNGTYLITSVTHSAQEGGFYSGIGGTQEATYDNTFTAIPHSAPFRPPRLTPKPVVHGSQTAIVVGPSGEEIYTDKYGRVKVQFHWDRLGQYDEKSSCWIRVSQPWAGKGWGAIWIPRIGQEVIVDFLEGDPDRPIITGRVYNANQMPPYELPGQQTKSAIKTYSSKGGGGFNELRFEDKKGSEQIFLHAQGRMDVRVKGNCFETIGGERHLIIEKDRFELVKKHQHLQVKGDRNERVDGTVSLDVGMDLHQKVGSHFALAAEQAIHLKAGISLVIESGTNLSLKVGGSFISLTPGGIFIQGTLVNINSGGSPGSGAGAHPSPPKDPKEADTARPGERAEMPPPPRPPKPETYSPMASALRQAARNGTPFCDT